jgi:hypothetical protein
VEGEIKSFGLDWVCVGESDDPVRGIVRGFVKGTESAAVCDGAVVVVVVVDAVTVVDVDVVAAPVLNTPDEVKL